MAGVRGRHRQQVRDLQQMEVALAVAPDGQISLTDPDARAMATNGKGTGLVGYNVQAVVDAEHPLAVAHEVTNEGHDRSQLTNMTRRAKLAMAVDDLKVLADRGYFSGEEILGCEQAGATPTGGTNCKRRSSAITIGPRLNGLRSSSQTLPA